MIKRRYQMFFWLMDFSFVLCWMGVAAEFWNYLGHEDPTHPIWQAFYFFAGYASLLIPMFLVFARFMQDQFILDLLQKTASSMLRFIFTFYPLLLIFGILLHLLHDILPKHIYAIFYYSPPGVFLNHLSEAGAFDGVLYCWIMATIAFTTIFEWHRWRASR